MANFQYDLGCLGPFMYGYATVTYNLNLGHLKLLTALAAVTKPVFKVKLVLGK